jgi:carbon storage regulator
MASPLQYHHSEGGVSHFLIAFREDLTMLILSRKVGERIVIGSDITVVVSRVSGDRVTLGLEAPSNVHILRGELRPFDEQERAEKTAPVASGRHTQRGDKSFGADRRRTPR